MHLHEESWDLWWRARQRSLHRTNWVSPLGSECGGDLLFTDESMLQRYVADTGTGRAVLFERGFKLFRIHRSPLEQHQSERNPRGPWRFDWLHVTDDFRETNS